MTIFKGNSTGFRRARLFDTNNFISLKTAYYDVKITKKL